MIISMGMSPVTKRIVLFVMVLCITLLSLSFFKRPKFVDDAIVKVKKKMDQAIPLFNNDDDLGELTRAHTVLRVTEEDGVLFDPYNELKGPLPSNYDPPGIEPCGVVCSYTGVIVNTTKTIAYPEIRKSIDCENVMKRMAFKNHNITYPPPKRPPEELRQQYEMYGDMKIGYRYYKTPKSPAETKPSNLTKAMIETLMDKVKKGVNINSYSDGMCVQNTLKKHSGAINKTRAVVIGTIRPWLESILLANGADHVTTLEYQALLYGHPQIDAYTPYDFAEQYLKDDVEGFDFAASFSSIEHSGLGRYNDPLNPYGDLEAVAQVWCMLKPGGIFALGIPFTDLKRNGLAWNAHRVYGAVRLQHLTANWKLLEYARCKFHSFLVLLKDDTY